MTRKDCGHFGRAARTAIAMAALLGCGAATVQAQSASIRLWRRAVVDDDVVRLADVARIEGFTGESFALLADQVVADAPAPGQRVTVDHDQILSRLKAAGLRLVDIRLSGATAVEVSRPAGSAPQPPREQDSEPDALGATVHQKKETTDPHTLGGAVEAYIRGALARYDGEVEITYHRSRRLQSALDLSEPQYQFRIAPSNSTPLGIVCLRVDVVSNGQVEQTVPVMADVALMRRVVIARRPINRGQTVDVRDVALEVRRFTDAGDLGEVDARALIGQQARRFVDKDALLTGRDVAPLPLVRRGQLINVYRRKGGLLIKTVAKAMGTGAYGDTIIVRNEASKRSFEVTITGPQSAEVRDDAVLAAVGGRE